MKIDWMAYRSDEQNLAELNRLVNGPLRYDELNAEAYDTHPNHGWSFAWLALELMQWRLAMARRTVENLMGRDAISRRETP